MCVYWNKTFSAQQCSIYFVNEKITFDPITHSMWLLVWWWWCMVRLFSETLSLVLWKIKCALEMCLVFNMKNTCTCFAGIIKTFYAFKICFSKSAHRLKKMPKPNRHALHRTTQSNIYFRAKVKCRNVHLIVWLSTSIMYTDWSNETNYIRFKWNRTTVCALYACAFATKSLQWLKEYYTQIYILYNVE